MSNIIYWTLIETPANFPGDNAGFLAASERQKLATLRFRKRREEWLLGRWTAKSLVQSIPAYQRYSLDEIEIRNNPEGAPRFFLPGEAAPPDCLTISHRDRFALCALVPGADLHLGADLEIVEPHTAAFVADYFTAEEQRLVSACPAEARETIICLVWSAKESMLKALGVGLRWDTRQVEIREITTLETGISKAGGWHPLQVRDATRNDRQWAAWWQRRGPLILTMAGFSDQIDPWTMVLTEQHVQNRLASLIK